MDHQLPQDCWSKGKFDPHKARRSHRETSIQIRKQQRSSKVRQRRGIRLSPEERAKLLQTCAADVASFLQSPNSTTGSLPAILGKDMSTTGEFLHRLLEEKEEEATWLVSHLMHLLQEYRKNPNGCQYALSILHEMIAALALTAEVGNNRETEPNSYYGRPPLRWDDLFFPTTSSPNTIVSHFASLLQVDMYKQKTLDCWTHLVTYAPSSTVRASVPTHWSLLCATIPLSLPCCAAIVQHDDVHYGMDLLRGLSSNNNILLDWNHLLASSDGAALLYGMVRREPAVRTHVMMMSSSSSNSIVHALCTHVATQPVLLSVLYQCLMDTTTSTTTTSTMKRDRRRAVLQPALPGVQVQLEQHRNLDAMAVWCLLQGPVASVPHLVETMIARETTHAWKAEACHLLSSTQEYVVDFFASTATTATREALIQSLVQLLKVNDSAHASLRVLDAILRSLPESQRIFENFDGVNVLERFSIVPDTDTALADMAGSLVDDLFDDDGNYNMTNNDTPAYNVNPALSFIAPQGRGRGRTLPAWQQQQRNLNA